MDAFKVEMVIYYCLRLKEFQMKGGDNMEKHEYTAPVLEESEEMVFTKEAWEEFNEGRWCFGCTNCNCN